MRRMDLPAGELARRVAVVMVLLLIVGMLAHRARAQVNPAGAPGGASAAFDTDSNSGHWPLHPLPLQAYLLRICSGGST